MTATRSAAEPIFVAPHFGTIEGVRVGSDQFAAGGIQKECDEVTFAGSLDGNSKSLEIEPIYSECTAKALTGLHAKFVFGRCVYRLHDSYRLPGKERWRARVDLACPVEYMEWNLYETETAYEFGHPACITKMPPQSEVGTAELSNMPDDRGLEVHWRLGKIKYKTYGPRRFGSSFLCGSLLEGVSKDASYVGTSTIVAKNLAGNTAELSVRG